MHMAEDAVLLARHAKETKDGETDAVGVELDALVRLRLHLVNFNLLKDCGGRTGNRVRIGERGSGMSANNHE